MRKDVPWAVLDSALNTNGLNLAPGYAFDVGAGGFVGSTFNVKTHPGLNEWLAYDFEGFRNQMYMIRLDWKEQGLLDSGVQDLDKISKGLTAKFLSQEPKEHMTTEESLSLPFRFNIFGSATPITREEFIADQSKHAEKIRQAILIDIEASETLQLSASDKDQWEKAG